MVQELCSSVWGLGGSRPQKGNDRAGDKERSLLVLFLDVHEPLTPSLLKFPTPHSL